MGNVLVGRVLLFVSPLPLRQIPNFETPATADERNLAFQAKLLADIFGEDKPALFVSPAVLRACMDLAQENATLRRRDRGILLHVGIHFRERLRRHDEQIFAARLGKNDEFLGLATAPARGNGEAILLVNRMAEVAGVESLWL